MEKNAGISSLKQRRLCVEENLRITHHNLFARSFEFGTSIGMA